MTDAPPPPAGDEPFEPWLDVFPPDKPPNELLIGLCAGRDLAIRDTSVFTKGGSSDPRCVFSIKDRPDLKCQSTVKKKNLNPVYGETFSFELGADELEAPTLHVRCEDYDVGSAPDSMGIFDVKLRGKENKRKRKWYNLKDDPSSKDKVSGAIELVIFWRHNPALASVRRDEFREISAGEKSSLSCLVGAGVRAVPRAAGPHGGAEGAERAPRRARPRPGPRHQG